MCCDLYINYTGHYAAPPKQRYTVEDSSRHSCLLLWPPPSSLPCLCMNPEYSLSFMFGYEPSMLFVFQICQSVWSPQSVETCVQEFCLPFLRLSSLLHQHLYGSDLPQLSALVRLQPTGPPLPYFYLVLACIFTNMFLKMLLIL